MWIMSTPTKWQQIIAKKKLSRTLYVDVFIYLWWRRQAIRLLWFCSLITSAAVPIDRLPGWVSLFENDMGMLFRLLLCIAYMSISIGTPIYVNLLYFDIFFGPILILCAIRFHYTELSVSHLNDFQGCAEYESLLYYYTYFFLLLLWLHCASTFVYMCVVFVIPLVCIIWFYFITRIFIVYGSYIIILVFWFLLLFFLMFVVIIEADTWLHSLCVCVCVLIVFHLMLIISKRNHLFSLYSMAIRL